MDAPQPATPRGDRDPAEASGVAREPDRAEDGAPCGSAASPTTLERLRALWCTFVRGLG